MDQILSEEQQLEDNLYDVSSTPLSLHTKHSDRNMSLSFQCNSNLTSTDNNNHSSFVYGLNIKSKPIIEIDADLKRQTNVLSYKQSALSDNVKHLINHAGFETFRCYYCGCIFKKKDILDEHISVNHNGTFDLTLKNKRSALEKISPECKIRTCLHGSGKEVHQMISKSFEKQLFYESRYTPYKGENKTIAISTPLGKQYIRTAKDQYFPRVQIGDNSKYEASSCIYIPDETQMLERIL